MALIDEKSLDKEGRWPWPRSKIASLVNILSQDGAKVIGFDIGFLEPDENSHLGFINQFGQKIDALDIQDTRLTDFMNENKENADNDLALAKAIRNSSSKVVLGYFFHMSQAELDYRIDQKEIDKQIERISASKYPFVISDDPRMEFFPFPKAYAPESNLEILTEATSSAGFFTLAADDDGVVRWMPLIIQCGENLYPPLSVSCAWLYLDKPQLMVKVARYGAKGIEMGERFIPTDENGQLLINYLGPPKTFQHVSITDILDGKIAKGTFKDRIVLVGATAMGTHDLRSTPFSVLLPGRGDPRYRDRKHTGAKFPEQTQVVDHLRPLCHNRAGSSHRDRPSPCERCERDPFCRRPVCFAYPDRPTAFCKLPGSGSISSIL